MPPQPMMGSFPLVRRYISLSAARASSRRGSPLRPPVCTTPADSAAQDVRAGSRARCHAACTCTASSCTPGLKPHLAVHTQMPPAHSIKHRAKAALLPHSGTRFELANICSICIGQDCPYDWRRTLGFWTLHQCHSTQPPHRLDHHVTTCLKPASLINPILFRKGPHLMPTGVVSHQLRPPHGGVAHNEAINARSERHCSNIFSVRLW